MNLNFTESVLLYGIFIMYLIGGNIKIISSIDNVAINKQKITMGICLLNISVVILFIVANNSLLPKFASIAVKPFIGIIGQSSLFIDIFARVLCFVAMFLLAVVFSVALEIIAVIITIPVYALLMVVLDKVLSFSRENTPASWHMHRRWKHLQ